MSASNVASSRTSHPVARLLEEDSGGSVDEAILTQIVSMSDGWCATPLEAILSLHDAQENMPGPAQRARQARELADNVTAAAQDLHDRVLGK